MSQDNQDASPEAGSSPEKTRQQQSTPLQGPRKNSCPQRYQEGWKKWGSCATGLLIVGIGIGIPFVVVVFLKDENLHLAGFALITVLVLVVLPVISWMRCFDKEELRGLGLPRGSVRAMLALWMVGTYLLFLIYAATNLGKPNDDSIEDILTAFGPLVGAVLAFYFAQRASTSTPSNNREQRNPTSVASETEA